MQNLCRGEKQNTYLFLLLIKVVNDDTNEQIQSEEGAEDDEDDKINIHVNVVLIDGLVLNLQAKISKK